jgi:hypothetical protein
MLSLPSRLPERLHSAVHVVCTSTLTTRSTALLDRARAKGRLWHIDTGHDLMITEPEK